MGNLIYTKKYCYTLSQEEKKLTINQREIQKPRKGYYIITIKKIVHIRRLRIEMEKHWNHRETKLAEKDKY